MWGNYNYQASGLSMPSSPVSGQGSQGAGSTPQPGINAPDSFSASKKRKKPWNWPLIAVGLSCLGILGTIVISKGRKTPKAIPPPETGKVVGREKVSKEEFKGFSSRKFRFVQALPGFKISRDEYDEVTRSYSKVPKVFRRITEKDNKKVFLVTGGVSNAPHMAHKKGKLTWDGRQVDKVGGVSSHKGAVVSVDLEKNRLNDVVLHEVGHNTDHSLGRLSSKREWQKIYKHYKNVQNYEGYGPSATFLSSYCLGKPCEFFAECFFYYYSSDEKRAILPKNIQAYFAKLEARTINKQASKGMSKNNMKSGRFGN